MKVLKKINQKGISLHFFTSIALVIDGQTWVDQSMPSWLLMTMTHVKGRVKFPFKSLWWHVELSSVVLCMFAKWDDSWSSLLGRSQDIALSFCFLLHFPKNTTGIWIFIFRSYQCWNYNHIYHCNMQNIHTLSNVVWNILRKLMN